MSTNTIQDEEPYSESDVEDDVTNLVVDDHSYHYDDVENNGDDVTIDDDTAKIVAELGQAFVTNLPTL